MKTEQTIYTNGRYKVVPLIRGYVVKGADGMVIQTFAPDEIVTAVETVDEMAHGDGWFRDVAA